MKTILIIMLLIAASIPNIVKRIEKYKDIERFDQIESVLMGLNEK